MADLTAKQQAFINEYLLDLNATQAAIRAGYAKTTADKKASLWVGKSRESCPENMRHVWDAVNVAKEARSERTEINADWLLKRLAAEADAKLSEIYNEDGSIKSVHDWPEIWQKGLVCGIDVQHITSIAQDEDGNVQPFPATITKIRISDRIKRLELIGRHVNVQAFKDRTETEVPGLKEVLEAVAGTSRGLPSGEKPE